MSSMVLRWSTSKIVFSDPELRGIRHADILKRTYLCQVSDTGSPEPLVLYLVDSPPIYLKLNNSLYMNEIDILLVNFIYTNKNENKFYNFMHV